MPNRYTHIAWQLRILRDELLQRLVTELIADERVIAAWLSGSIGRGTADDWSDLDVFVAVADAAVRDWLSDRHRLYARVGPALMEGPPGQQVGLLSDGAQAVLFPGPISLDLECFPFSLAKRDIDTQILFERQVIPRADASVHEHDDLVKVAEQRLVFFWSMYLIALKYVGRRNTARAVSQFELLCGAFIDVWRVVHMPRRLGQAGQHWLSPTADEALIRTLPRLDETIDAAAMLRALGALADCMTDLHPAFAQLGVAIPDAGVEAVRRLERAIVTASPEQ